MQNKFYNANHAYNYLWDYIIKNGVDFVNIFKLLKTIIDSKSEEEIKLMQNAPSISDYWTPDDKAHFTELCNFLDAMGVKFEIDHNLVRGLDYYSRTTFEILSSSLGAQDALCGGGRYDGLVEMIGGKPTPGIGLSLIHI